MFRVDKDQNKWGVEQALKENSNTRKYKHCSQNNIVISREASNELGKTWDDSFLAIMVNKEPCK